MNWNARTRSETDGYTFADTRAPYHAQYLLNFRLVNATGVPVFRTRHVAGPVGYGNSALSAHTSPFVSAN
jgi:hypothetical protein